MMDKNDLVWVISTPWTSLSPLPGKVKSMLFLLGLTDCGERSIISNTLPSSPGAGWRGRREAERQPLHVGSWSTPWSSYQWLSSDAFLMRNCGVLAYRIKTPAYCTLGNKYVGFTPHLHIGQRKPRVLASVATIRERHCGQENHYNL